MLAPVALFVYSRPEHTQRTVEALLINPLAEETDVIVFSDAAKGAEKEQAVAAVREYVAGVKGFKSLTVHHRPHNYGLAKSIIDGVSQVVREHGRVIVLEDDMVTSPYFLTYMNDGLKRFADDERVISLHGYMYPVKRPLPEAFFLPGADCWGWATWARGWALFNPDGQYLLDELRQRGLQKAFDFNGSYAYSGMLERQIAGSNDSWAIRWYASAFLAGKLTLYPGRSLVHNIGNDDSGSHCGTTTALDVAVSESPIGLDGIDAKPSQDALDAVEEFFRSKQPALRKVLSSVLSHTMMTNAKAMAKEWMPPVMVRAMWRLLRGGGIRFEGEFSSWDEAAAHCSGYDAGNILEKVLDASLQVKNGVFAFERDSVLFDEIEYSWPVTAALMHVAARSGGRLHVLDFGGALGSSYFQNRKFLDGLKDVRWCVVEQEHYVEAGRNHLQDERLTFCRSIGEATEALKPNIVLLSSVLQYLKEPYSVLRELLDLKSDSVLVDRTPFYDGAKDCALVQNVPKEIYRASYPMWVMNENMFLREFDGDYEVVEGYVSPEGTVPMPVNGEMTFKGFIVRRMR